LADTNQTSRWREWLSQKLNPIQPTIASMHPYVVPETIVEFEQAYREIEIVLILLLKYVVKPLLKKLTDF